MHSRGASYHPLAELDARSSLHYDGEVQLIPGFADRVSAARVARREVQGGARTIATDDAREAIYARTDRALYRLHAARGRPGR